LLICDVVQSAGTRQQAIDQVARHYRQYANRCLAVCNTATTADYADAFDSHGVPVLAWIHELPTSIQHFCGGAPTMARFQKSARRTLCPSEVVRASLVSTYGFDADTVDCMHYGALAPAPDLSRRELRALVREELGISKDAYIVL